MNRRRIVHASLLLVLTAMPAIATQNAVWIDARPVLKDYLAGHVPGARTLSPEALRSADGGVPAKLEPPEVLRVLFGRAGLEIDRPVVVYAAGTDPDATLVATALRLSGFKDVRIHDGGFARWQAEGGTATAARERHPTTEPKVDFRHGEVAGLDDVRAAIAVGAGVIVDVRPPEQYEKGHIPGAVNRPWTRDLVPEGQPAAGTWKPREVLLEEYAALGIGPETPVIVYCNTGHMASFGYWTLRERLGFGKVRLYDGSWVEWSMSE